MERRCGGANRKDPTEFFNFPQHRENQPIPFKIFYKALENGSKEKHPQNLALSSIAPRAENVGSSGVAYTPAFPPQAGPPASFLRTCFPVIGVRSLFPASRMVLSTSTLSGAQT